MHQKTPISAVADRASDNSRERAVLLRPGVTIPDWSVVQDGSAGMTLSAIFELIGVGRRKWSSLGEMEDRVWRSVIELFAEFGRAPLAAEIAGAIRLPQAVVADALTELGARDVVVLDDAGRIVGAYPFTERPTGHRVRLRGKTLTAMCAIDALGIGAMFSTDTDIESSCRHCGTAIRVNTRAAGAVLANTEPTTAIVWAGLHYAGGCSATSLCTVLAFFCSEEHLAAWRASASAGQSGHRLSMNEALQVGKAIFMPILRTAAEGQAAALAQ